jgi:hypothetical protein
MTALAGRLAGRLGATGMTLALLIAVGIGLHNLGEGLAIGASFALGELQLGAFLIVGFMIHNVTEGLGIATPVAKDARDRSRARRARVPRRSSGGPRRLDRRLHDERRARRALLRDRCRRRAPGRGRGRSATCAHLRPAACARARDRGFIAGIAAMYVTGVSGRRERSATGT